MFLFFSNIQLKIKALLLLKLIGNFNHLCDVVFGVGKRDGEAQGRTVDLLRYGKCVYSLGHGMNDAQKTMGIIALLLFNRGYLGANFHVPFWVEMACYVVIALGTMSGGWRIVKTMGTKITKLRPMGGFAAETAAAISIITATFLGIPVSTTHTITGAIVGVGATKRWTAVRWGVAGNIIWAWVMTIPMSALVAALIYGIIHLFQ